MAEKPTVPEHQFKELDKFVMFAPAPGVDNRRSRLQWSSYRGNPRISVFTSVPNDTNKGVISAPMNPETFFGLLHLLEKIATNPAGTIEFTVDCDTLERTADGSQGRRILLSTILVGRDDEGVVYIQVKADNRPEIRFYFKISDFHRFKKGDGTPFSDREASSLQALAAVQCLRMVFGQHVGELRAPYVAPGKGPTPQRPAQPNKTAADFEDFSF